MLEKLTRRDFIKATLAVFSAAILPAKLGCEGSVQTVIPVTGTVTETLASATLTPAPITQPQSAATITRDANTARPAGWSKLSHSNDVDPDYGTVFPADRVNRLKVTISPDNWAAMQADMQNLFGSGMGGAQGPGGQLPGGQFPFQPGGQIPIISGLPNTGFPNVTGAPSFPGANPGTATPPAGRDDFPAFEPGFPGGGMGGDMTSVNPMWVPCTLEFNSLTWTNVGVRYKGNSSLSSGWQSRSLKLPLKLDFDQFENEHPEINNQRFFGFKQLSLSNAFSDSSSMREAIAYELLEESGLPASQTAYYQIIMEYGEGEKDLGIYIVIEVPDDTSILHYFGEDSGNIYEGDGSGVSLASNVTAASIKSSFQKENNTDTDWSDILTLQKALHDTSRTTDAAAWRVGLEKVFDVDIFLEWLAISAVIQHWDNYGQMSHNFYLYHDPDSGRLVWISWDHNMVLGVGGVGDGGPGGMGRDVSLDKKEVGANWPLIRFLLDEPVYYSRYVKFLQEFVDGLFKAEIIEAKTKHYSALLNPYMSASSLSQAVQQLNNVVSQRIQAVRSFLASV
jgi:spore coat protein H